VGDQSERERSGKGEGLQEKGKTHHDEEVDGSPTNCYERYVLGRNSSLETVEDRTQGFRVGQK